MTYKPTGNPPGRPRKDGTPAQPKPPPEVGYPNMSLYRPWDTRNEAAFDGKLCEKCWPDGLPKWTVVGCKHGTWFNKR